MGYDELKRQPGKVMVLEGDDFSEITREQYDGLREWAEGDVVVEVSRGHEPFHVEDGIDDFDAVEVSNLPGEVQRVRLVDYDAGHVLRLRNVFSEYAYDEGSNALVRKEPVANGQEA